MSLWEVDGVYHCAGSLIFRRLPWSPWSQNRSILHFPTAEAQRIIFILSDISPRCFLACLFSFCETLEALWQTEVTAGRQALSPRQRVSLGRSCLGDDEAGGGPSMNSVARSHTSHFTPDPISTAVTVPEATELIMK